MTDESARAVVIELVKKGVVYGLGASLNGVAGFLLLPFIVHRLTAFEYGRFALAELLLNVLLVVGALGLHVALLARYPKLPAGDRRAFIGSVLSLLIVTTLVAELGFAAFAVVLGSRVFPELAVEHYVLVGAITALETVTLLVATVFRAEGAAWRFIAIQLVQVAMSLALTIALIARSGYREEALLYGRLGGDLLVILAVMPVLLHHRPCALAPAWGLVRMGGPLVLASFSAMAVAMLPRLLLEQLGDAATVGSYAVDAKLAAIVSIGFVQPFGLVYVAAIGRIAHRADARAIFARVVTYYIALGAIATVVVGAAAPWIARTLGNHAFPISPRAITLLAVSNVAAGLAYPLTIGPYVLERTRDVVPVYIATFVLAVAIGWPLTSEFGIVGAASALVAVYVVQGIALGWVSHRMYAMSLERGRLVAVIAGFVVVVTLVAR
jgi:O-antigen/teichoic acid export membrane protein